MPQPFRIKTEAFDAADLLLESFSCTEAFSTLTEMTASLLSPKGSLDADLILGKPVTFEIEQRDETQRFFHGFVTRFSQTGASGRFHRYQAVVRPWLWFLTRTTDCRIFQHQTVPDIVKTVFADHSIEVHEFKTFREYREREFCVQYRESDFAFVSRLLEHEGIYYRFEHIDGKHTLLLLDSLSANDPQPDGADELPFFVSGGREPPDIDFVSRWAMSRSVQPGKFAIDDYDFENPSSKLLTTGEQPRPSDQSDGELYDYPGIFHKPPDGQQLLENRRDEVESRFEVFSGSTNSLALHVGFTFNLKRHPRDDQNTEYLVTSTNLQVSNGGFDAGEGSGASSQCNFTAIPSRQQYRPPRATPTPYVRGVQTAVVVGKAGEEIHTDKFGRVRVQFRWDRLGKKDDKSSCLVRVAQVWAGKNFGAIFIPRVGQEVIVDFLEGDPDEPIITGSVYNGEVLPPFKLPDNATQSGFLSRSTKDGVIANANMIQFEDKKGSEALNLHAEKNMSTSVENDQSNSVGHDLTEEVKHDRKATIKNKDTLIVQEGGRSVTVGAGGESVNLTGGRKYTVGGGLDQNILNSGRVTAVTGPDSLFITGAVTQITTGATTLVFDGGLKASVIGDMKYTASGKIEVKAGADFIGNAANFRLKASGNMEFQCTQFNRTVNVANDVILGPNTSSYIGQASSTMIAGARNTFVGMRNDVELALKMSTSIGAAINTTIAANLNIGVAATIDMMAGPTLELGPVGLQQKTVDVAQSAMKVITGGGGGGGGGGGAAGPAATAIAVAAVAGSAAAKANAVAAAIDVYNFLKAVHESPDASLAKTLLGTFLSMPLVALGLGDRAYGAVAGVSDAQEDMDAVAAKHQAEVAKEVAKDAQDADAASAAAIQAAEDAANNVKNDLPDALPALPDAPSLPAVPSLPGVPDIPSMPGMPDLPSMPNVPSMPSMPSMPAVPNVPDVPSLPAVPAMPAVPEMPAVPGIPAVPGVPSVPDAPGLPGAPGLPNVPGLPDPPLPKF